MFKEYTDTEKRELLERMGKLTPPEADATLHYVATQQVYAKDLNAFWNDLEFALKYHDNLKAIIARRTEAQP